MVKQTVRAKSMLKKAYLAVLVASITAASGAFAADYTLNSIENALTQNNPDEAASGTWFGPQGENTAANNNVVINLQSGTLNEAFGGYTAADGTAAGNTLTVSGKTVADTVYGGFAPSGQANNNTVIVEKGAIISGQVVGGSALTAANGNTVVINGKVGDYGVLGGAAEKTSGNTVILGSGAEVGGAVIGGGFDIFRPNKETNTLTVSGPAAVGAVAAFSVINLDLKNVDGKTAALTVNGASKTFFDAPGVTDVYNKVDLADTTLNLVNYADGKNIITVSDNEYIKGININGQTKVVSDAIYVKDTWTAAVADDTDIGNTLNDTVLNDETLFARTREVSKQNVTTLSDAVLGTAALVNQNAEFIANDGIRAMRDATADVYGLAPFGAIVGSYSEYQTGSHVDLSSVHALTGIAGNNGALTSAVYAEFGYGSSTSHVHGVSADADHNYYGIGVAGRYDFNYGPYLDASLHIGKTSTDFDGSYAEGIASYDIDQLYVGAHIGGGYVIDFSDTLNLDVYGRYTYTYTDSDDTQVDGEKFKIDAVNTHALRLGTRLNGYLTDLIQGYVGLAVDQVIDGDAESTISSVALDTPSLEGTTGIAECGVAFRPNEKVQINLGAKGYVGDRRGVQGSLIGLYTF